MVKSYFGGSDPKIIEYVAQTFQPEDAVLREVRERSTREGLPEIQVATMDSLHLEVLARLSGVRKAVEVGTLGGYSGIAIARALPKDGKLYTLEIEPKHAEVARESFKKAGLADKVEILLGPALKSLQTLSPQGPFDLIFIDADKVSYPAYIQWAADNLRVGGILIGDNTFGFGMIADRNIEDAEDRAAVEALREFNRTAAQSGRFRATLLPTGEGLTVAVKLR